MNRLALALSALLVWSACEPSPPHATRAELGPIRYEGVLSLNDRCPVRGDPLNRAVQPVYVNGRPLGFC